MTVGISVVVMEDVLIADEVVVMEDMLIADEVVVMEDMLMEETGVGGTSVAVLDTEEMEVGMMTVVVVVFDDVLELFFPFGVGMMTTVVEDLLLERTVGPGP